MWNGENVEQFSSHAHRIHQLPAGRGTASTLGDPDGGFVHCKFKIFQFDSEVGGATIDLF